MKDLHLKPGHHILLVKNGSLPLQELERLAHGTLPEGITATIILVNDLADISDSAEVEELCQRREREAQITILQIVLAGKHKRLGERIRSMIAELDQPNQPE